MNRPSTTTTKSSSATTFNANNQSSVLLVTSNGNRTMFSLVYRQNELIYLLGSITPPVLMVLGFYGNVMTIIIMRRMRASESTGCLPVYFTALAVSDLFLLITNFMGYWPEIALNSQFFYTHDLSCLIPYYVRHVSAMTSAWLLVAMTFQRMTSVLVPHRVELLCSVRKGKMVVSGVLLASCTFNLYILFLYHVDLLEEGYPSCVEKDQNLAIAFTFLYVCLASFVPFLCLILANFVIIWGVVKSVKLSRGMIGHGGESKSSSRSSNVSSMTTTLILTSAAFLVLTLPFCVKDMYLAMIGYYAGEIVDRARIEQLALLDITCILLYMSNGAINFYIYILSGRKFRQEAKQCLCKRFTTQQPKYSTKS